jgi:4-hydroxybenzoate polyprenyltransferase
MDELKDREVDRELFSERPLPSGRVLEADIKASLVVVICCYLAVNSWTGKAFLMSIVLLAYSFLMFKFFFMPHILSRYLLLNLATHNPVVPLMLLYLVTLFSTEHGISIRSMNWFLVTALVMMFWSIFFSWEIARKIRSSQEENDYVTYSRILGPLGAVLVAGGAQTFAFGIGTYFYFSFSLSWLFLVLLSIAYSRVLWAYFRFILHPDPVTSKLKPIAEQYAGIIFLAGLIDYISSN